MPEFKPNSLAKPPSSTSHGAQPSAESSYASDKKAYPFAFHQIQPASLSEPLEIIYRNECPESVPLSNAPLASRKNL